MSGKCPVFLDGGVRNGRDVFKAVALGASGVFVGRPVVWGLAVGVCRQINRYNRRIGWQRRQGGAKHTPE